MYTMAGKGWAVGLSVTRMRVGWGVESGTDMVVVVQLLSNVRRIGRIGRIG